MKSSKRIQIAVCGCGWFGRGLIYELAKWPNIEPRLVFNRTAQKAVDCLLKYGVDKQNISVVTSAKEMQTEFLKGQFVVCDNFECVKELPVDIDLFFEATGDVLVAATCGVEVLKQKKHYVTVSAEMDATVGFVLNALAEENGVIYSNSDGDQPGCIARLMSYVQAMGFEVVAAGNGKGFLNVYATPESIMEFVRPGDSPKRIASFTDGTKQSLEMAVLANGTGLVPDCRGMHGVKTTKKEMVHDVMSSVSQEGVVEYVMGKEENLGMTVFVIGKINQDYAFDDCKYLRMGDGPNYLFFRDYHLCYFEAPLTIAEIVLSRKTTISPKKLNADVFTVAKRDLKQGTSLDGIGGFDAYGLIDKYENVNREKLLPMGLSEYTVMKKDVAIDTPITMDMVDFLDFNLVCDLRKQQDDNFKITKKLNI